MSVVRRILALLALLAFAVTDRKEIILDDIRRWAEIQDRRFRMPGTLVDLVAERTEFRTLMYHRLYYGNTVGRLVGWAAFLLLRKRVALYLSSEDIGSGFYIQHGFATAVDAEHIGRNVWVNQQVTIGYNVDKDGVPRKPTIEDGATIYAGAKVLGGVRVGRDAVIGANAVVTKDVPEGMLAVGVPAVIRERSR
jgi:serine O-acetyltransferase